MPEPVVRLAEGHAGETPRHEARVDGREAPEQARVPRLGVLGRLGVEHLTGLL